MPKKKQEPVIEKEPEEPEEEEVTCPICGKPVGLEVMTCPHCGAEFEEEAVVEEEVAEAAEPKPAKEAPPASEEEMAECPVCGKMVGLTVPSCPYCGAEFEEEEVEEVIEVEEEETVAPKPAPAKAAKPVREEAVVEEEAAETEEEEFPIEGPASILDFRVIGASLIILGILGSQIAFMIDWYWSWVPPIEDHLGLFVAIPAVIIVVGLLVFLLIKRFASEGKKVPRPIPWMSLSIFLFGILALVVMMLWNPINEALQSSNLIVGIAFVAVLLVGAVLTFLGSRSPSKATA